MSKSPTVNELIHRLRSRAMIEAPEDNEPDTAAFDDVTEITSDELHELCGLLNEAADVLDEAVLAGTALVALVKEYAAAKTDYDYHRLDEDFMGGKVRLTRLQSAEQALITYSLQQCFRDEAAAARMSDLMGRCSSQEPSR